MSVTLVKGRPLSPPSSTNGEIYQHGLHHLLQHNASNSFSSDQYDYDERLGTESRATSSYGSSPYQPQEERHHFLNRQPSYIYGSSQNPRYNMHRNGYQDNYQHDDHTYGTSPDEHQMYQNSYETPAESPPTPAMPENILTRSGLSITRPSSNLKMLPHDKSRQVKSPRMKKARKEKDRSEKKMAIKLDKPLSELCKEWTHVNVTDIEAYVNRSAKERRKEVEDAKDPGKVKRPMNSFMLYRKAYQHVTKEFYLHNNHQFVSQVCGDSWRLETDAIVKQFKQWATLERINHANAHPGYKFRPSKAGAAKTANKRKNTDELESDLEISDLEDYDWEASSSTKRSAKRAKQIHNQERQPPYHFNSSPYGYSRDVSTEPMPQGHNRSSYQSTNPGKPLPPQYSQDQLHNGQYYQQTVHQNSLAPGVEDVVIRKTAAPGMHYLGLPRGQDFDIMQPQYSSAFDSTPDSEPRIDPSLLADESFVPDESYSNPMAAYIGQEEYHDGSIFPGSYGVLDQEYHDNAVDYLEAVQPLDTNTLQLQEHHAHLLKGDQDAWQIDQSLDAGEEFDNWYEAAH